MRYILKQWLLAAVYVMHLWFHIDAKGIPTVSETQFAEKPRETTSALVAFVAPWCIACRSLVTELVRVQASLVQDVSVAVFQCDTSMDPQLAARYHVQRTPVAVFFPDTKVLSPGFQLVFSGQLLYRNLMSFVQKAHRLVPPRLTSESDLRALQRKRIGGSFVGLFTSPSTTSVLQDLWKLDCLGRQDRALTFEGLCTWAAVDEDAIVFTRDGLPLARFSEGDARDAGLWREQVKRFCTWCERQVLPTVVMFDARRAAALDGTFDWMLMAFVTPPDHDSKIFNEEKLGRRFLVPQERAQLEKFISDARSE